MLGGRGCSDWLPERRLRADIELAGLDVDERTACLQRCWNAQGAEVAWLYAAEADWQASGPRETPQRYVFRMEEGPLRSFTCVRSGSGGRWVLSATEADESGCSCP